MKKVIMLLFVAATMFTFASCNNNAEPVVEEEVVEESAVVDTVVVDTTECEEADEYAAYDEFEYSSHSSSERDHQHQHNHQHQHDNNQNNNSQSHVRQPIQEWINCPLCSGSGICMRCGGTGWMPGPFGGNMPCSRCQANQNGLCSRCAGRGLILNTY